MAFGVCCGSRSPSKLGDRATVLELINHPISSGIERADTNYVGIEVVDSWVFPNHCMFDANHVSLLNDSTPSPAVIPAKAATCGEPANADRVTITALTSWG